MQIKCGFSVIKEPVENYLKYAAIHGLRHLEIDLLQEHSFLETFNSRRIGNLKKLSGELNLSLSFHVPYTLNLADKIPDIVTANAKYLKSCILLAYKLGATHITLHAGYYNGLVKGRDIRRLALEKLALNLAGVLTDCEKYRVNLALENINSMPNHYEFACLGDNVGDFEFLFSRFKSPHINLCLDTGHANLSEGVIPYIKRLGEKIICVHYHDNKGGYDQHLDSGLGTVPWPAVVRAFKKAGFMGPFVSETFGKLKPHQGRDRFIKYWQVK